MTISHMRKTEVKLWKEGADMCLKQWRGGAEKNHEKPDWMAEIWIGNRTSHLW